jgi:hypothetical protein
MVTEPSAALAALEPFLLVIGATWGAALLVTILRAVLRGLRR